MNRYLEILQQADAVKAKYPEEEMLAELSHAVNEYCGVPGYAVSQRGLLLPEGQEFRVILGGSRWIELYAQGEWRGTVTRPSGLRLYVGSDQLRATLEENLRVPSLLAELKAVRKP